MTAKEYLRAIQLLDKRIDKKLELVERLRSGTQRVTSVLNPNRGSGHTVRDASGGIDRLVDLERELNGMIDQLADLKREAVAAINRLDDPRQVLLLEMRYLLGYRWERIADEMGYELRQVYRLHGVSLRNFQIPKTCHTMSV